MSSEQNKAVVRRAFDEPWRGRLGVVDELVTSDYIGHDPALPEPLRGPEDVKDFIATYLVAFPDGRMTITMQLADGDLMDVEPTGREVTVTGLTISRLEDGKISEEFRSWDFYGMLRQVEGASARVRA